MKDGGLPNKLNHMTSYCDKGAGILVVNFSDYVKSCKEHLESGVNGDYDEQAMLAIA